jgi:hypothetical protein
MWNLNKKKYIKRDKSMKIFHVSLAGRLDERKCVRKPFFFLVIRRLVFEKTETRAEGRGVEWGQMPPPPLTPQNLP